MELSEAKNKVKEQLGENADEVLAAFNEEIEKESNKKAEAVKDKKNFQKKYNEMKATMDELAEYAEGEDQSQQLENLKKKLNELEDKANKAESSKSEVEKEKERLENELSTIKQQQKIRDIADKLGAKKEVLSKLTSKRFELDEEGNVKVGAADAQDDQLQDFETFAENDEEIQAFWPALFPEQQSNQSNQLPSGSPQGANQQQSLSQSLRQSALAGFRTK